MPKIKVISNMYRHIPIIAVSANAFEGDRAVSIAAGMDDHVARRGITMGKFYSVCFDGNSAGKAEYRVSEYEGTAGIIL